MYHHSVLYAGVVANMVHHFNLRTTRSASQISSSPEISSPVSVRHTAGQKPGGAVLRRVFSSTSASNHLSHNFCLPDTTEAPITDADVSPQEKRFSGSGK